MSDRSTARVRERRVQLATFVPRNEWPATLQRYGAVHGGERVMLEVLGGLGLHATVVGDATLETLRLRSDGTLVVELLTGRGPPTQIEIVAPTTLELHRQANGKDSGLDVTTRDGHCYRLGLHTLPSLP